MSNEQDARRGEEAQRLLNEPLLQEAFTVIRDRLISQLESADVPEDRRERLNDLLVSLARVKRYLVSVVELGTAAANEIEQQTLMDKTRQLFRRA